MYPWLFLCTGWWCFMPMASLGGLVGGFPSPDLSIIKPGTMFIMDGNGEHQRYEVGEYDREVL